MKNIITISREFGSGGRSIAKEVAKKLGYEYFDVEIMERIAQTSGMEPEVEEKPEEITGYKSLFGYKLVGRGTKEASMENYLWNKQRDMILELGEKGNCVIVGRCADYLLRDNANTLHVFVHADMEYRAKHIVQLYGETNETPEKRLKDKDKMRKAAYEYRTDREWGLAQNYDITLNSSKLGQQRCVEIITGLAMAEDI